MAGDAGSRHRVDEEAAMAAQIEDELAEKLALRRDYAALPIDALQNGDVALARKLDRGVQAGRLALKRLEKPYDDATIASAHQNVSAWLRVMIRDLHVLLGLPDVDGVGEAVLTVIEQSALYPQRTFFGMEFGGAPYPWTEPEREALIDALMEFGEDGLLHGKPKIEKMARRIVARASHGTAIAVRDAVTRHRKRTRERSAKTAKKS
jgi:hypothetical protein